VAVFKRNGWQLSAGTGGRFHRNGWQVWTGIYNKVYKDHKVVNHGSKQYVDGIAHTNTVEGFFSILKRGITGVYQHVSKRHLDNYLSEFDFRYNYRKVADRERTYEALKGFEGKRLKYKTCGV
jgi:hypothetical protein